MDVGRTTKESEPKPRTSSTVKIRTPGSIRRRGNIFGCADYHNQWTLEGRWTTTRRPWKFSIGRCKPIRMEVQPTRQTIE
eukprot:964863-Heterocapsa_arctica.AAC.1